MFTPEQPYRPDRATDANQQHIHTLKLDDPLALPVEQGAFQPFPAALVLPPIGVLDEALLGGSLCSN